MNFEPIRKNQIYIASVMSLLTVPVVIPSTVVIFVCTEHTYNVTFNLYVINYYSVCSIPVIVIVLVIVLM